MEASSKMPPPIPVTLITGFLGSGKTTLLNALLKHEGMSDTAVIVNEFGEIGIDHLLVEQVDEGIIEMSSGCLCCTIRGDLVNTLEDLLRRLDNHRIKPFARVIIETTGLADPAPILHTIMTHPYLVMRYRLSAIIATIDAVNAMATFDRQEESVKQAAVADRLVLTKTDLVPEDDEPERFRKSGNRFSDKKCGKNKWLEPGFDSIKTGKALAPLMARLKSLNPAAPLLLAAKGEAVPESLFDAGLFDPASKSANVRRWLNEEAYADDHRGAHHHHDVNRHDARIEAFCLTKSKPLPESAFQMFMELLQAEYGGNLLRLKGIVALREDPGHPVVVHAVQHVLHPPVRLESWPDKDERTRLVFIMRDVSKTMISDLFDAFVDPRSAQSAAMAAEFDNPLSLNPGRGLLDDG